MKWRLAAALASLSSVLSVISPAEATTASVFGSGPVTRALGGAGATQALGYEAAFLNPAALGQTSRLSISAGYGVESCWLYGQRAGEAEHRFSTAPLGSSALGFTLPLPVLARPVVLGFASLVPGNSVATAALPLAEEPQFPLLLSRQNATDFALALGVQPWDWLALGVGVRALASLTGSAEVERGRRSTSTRVSDTLEPVLAPSAGVSAFLGKQSTLAFVARAALRADFDIRLSAVDLGATQLPPLNLSGVAHYDPLTLTLEYAQRVGSFTGLLGAVYQRYRAAPTLLPSTVSCPATRPDCAALDAEAPGLHDTVDLHVAATLALPLTHVASAMLRAGYAFIPSPVPEQTGDANLLDNSRHRLALGYALSLSEPAPPITLDTAVTLDALVPRTSHKGPNVPSDNAGAPAFTTRGRALGLSLGLTVKL